MIDHGGVSASFCRGELVFESVGDIVLVKFLCRGSIMEVAYEPWLVMFVLTNPIEVPGGGAYFFSEVPGDMSAWQHVFYLTDEEVGSALSFLAATAADGSSESR